MTDVSSCIETRWRRIFKKASDITKNSITAFFCCRTWVDYRYNKFNPWTCYFSRDCDDGLRRAVFCNTFIVLLLWVNIEAIKKISDLKSHQWALGQRLNPSNTALRLQNNSWLASRASSKHEFKSLDLRFTQWNTVGKHVWHSSQMVSTLTKTGRPIGCDLVSLGANALEAALCVHTVTSAAQQRVPLTLIDVWQPSEHTRTVNTQIREDVFSVTI